ncbi:MAG: carboxypeptidase regulatory-like domain-containing protein [Gemmatimonadota bacterium]
MVVRSRLFIPVLFLFGVVPSGLGAQIISGTVRDRISRERVPEALVVLLTADSSYLTQTATELDGGFRLPVPEPGDYRVFVRTMGYAPSLTEPLTVADREEIEVTVFLRADPVALDSLEVVTEARTRQLEMVGFYKRQKKGFGYFIEKEEINRSHASRITDLLYGLPGVRMVGNQATGELSVLLRGSQAKVVLDGMVLLDTQDINALVHPFNIEAIEIYPGIGGVPVQYRTIYGGSGGAILIWTRW